MRHRRAAIALAVIACIFAAPAARAERLVSSLSTHQVLIASNFTGTEIVLFGSVERDAATATRRGGYDLVVTVTGPREQVVARKKERVFGIWTNAASRNFNSAPAYLAVLSNRPLDAVAPSDLLQRLEVGFPNIPLSHAPAGAQRPILHDEFRDAVIRLKNEHGLYREQNNAVTFLTPNLFRASIILPAVAPLGTYDVDLRLFADGTPLARTNSALEIVKVGVEQFVATAARDHALLYGLATTLMALLTGWIASIVFRRD